MCLHIRHSTNLKSLYLSSMKTEDGWEIADPYTYEERLAMAKSEGKGYYLMTIEEIIEKWGSELSEQDLINIKEYIKTNNGELSK